MITYELSDMQILNEERVAFNIGRGRKKKKLILEMLPISIYYDVFIPKFVELLDHFKNLCNGMVLPTGKDWQDKKGMKLFTKYVKSGFSHKEVREDFIELLKAVGFLKMRIKFFEMNVNVAELVSIFVWIYKHNIDGLKKKVEEAIVEIAKDMTQLSPIYIESSSKKGGRKEKLMPRFQL